MMDLVAINITEVIKYCEERLEVLDKRLAEQFEGDDRPDDEKHWCCAAFDRDGVPYQYGNFDDCVEAGYAFGEYAGEQATLTKILDMLKAGPDF